jgi:hypothetical protein
MFSVGARGSVVGWGTMLQSRKVAVSSPDEVDFFNWPKPSRLTIALGSTLPLTEMSTRNLPGWRGCKGRDRSIRLTFLPPSVSRLSRENGGTSTSHSPMGLHGLLQGYFYLFIRRVTCRLTRSVKMDATEQDAQSLNSLRVESNDGLPLTC